MMTVKLTDTQLVMLSAAAQREDRCLQAPQALKGAAVGKVAAKLINLSLAREIEAKSDMPIWRRDKEGQGFALKLTVAGLKAIGVEDEEVSEVPAENKPTAKGGDKSDSRASPETLDVGAPRPGSKLAAVLTLLQNEEGAALDELVKATGWLPHTTRAALTGLRKRGYSVVRQRKDEGGSTYRITGSAEPAKPDGKAQSGSEAERAA